MGAITELSRQLLQQANPSIETLVRDDFINVVSLAIDKAMLHGDGVKQPEGLLTAATGTGTLLPPVVVPDLVSERRFDRSVNRSARCTVGRGRTRFFQSPDRR